MISVVFWSTAFDFLFSSFFAKQYREAKFARRLLRIASANYNVHQMFTVREDSSRVSHVDDMRFLFAIATAAVHSFGAGTDIRALPKTRELRCSMSCAFSACRKWWN